MNWIIVLLWLATVSWYAYLGYPALCKIWKYYGKPDKDYHVFTSTYFLVLLSGSMIVYFTYYWFNLLK